LNYRLNKNISVVYRCIFNAWHA